MSWLGSGGPAVSKLHPIWEKKRAMSVWGECTPTGSPFIPAGSLGLSPLLWPKTEWEIKRIKKSVVRFGAFGWETTIYLPSHREDSSRIKQKCFPTSSAHRACGVQVPGSRAPWESDPGASLQLCRSHWWATHELMGVKSKCACGGITKAFRQL